MRRFLHLAPLLLCCGAAPTGSLVGLYHLAGSNTECELISLDLATGANATLFTSVAACAGLTSSFPSYSAPGPAGALLVATDSAASVFSIDLATAASTPLGALANNASDILTGLAFFGAPGGGAFVTTQVR